MKQLRYIIFTLLFLTFSSALSQTAFVTKTGEKYHKSYCKYLKYSKKEIKLDKAISLGYKACKVCKPISKKTKTDDSIIQTISSKPKPENRTSTRRSTSVQCSGKTKKGRRCKRKIKSSSGRCYQH
jgi:hypothetical protein